MLKYRTSTLPEWGNLDILGACGASDSGSNPGSGVLIKFHISTFRIALFQVPVYILRDGFSNIYLRE